MPIFTIKCEVTEVRVFEVNRETREAALAAVQCGPIEAVAEKEGVEQVESYTDGMHVASISQREAQ